MERRSTGSLLGALERLKAAEEEEEEAMVAPERWGEATWEETPTSFCRRYLEGTSRSATL